MKIVQLISHCGDLFGLDDRGRVWLLEGHIASVTWKLISEGPRA